MSSNSAVAFGDMVRDWRIIMQHKPRKESMGVLRFVVVLVLSLAAFVMPSTAIAAQGAGATIGVGTVGAAPGDTVKVPVRVEGNPGILGATLEITYDSELTLTAAANGEAFSALAMTRPGSFASPCRFTWDGADLAADDIKNGEILVLTFTVSENAAADSKLAVSVSGEDGAVLDADLNPISVSYGAGGVTIADFTPGDVDGDSAVNSRDVIYVRRHIVGGYSQSINKAAADVNNDLQVNSADVILLRRHLAGGYGVELKRSDLDPDTGGSSEDCSHSLEAVAALNPTCTEDGNIAYWHCTKCGAYFSDQLGINSIALEDTIVMATGHTPVVDAAVAPTRTSTGLTEGSHCAACGVVIKEQQTVPVLEADEYCITYDVANGDAYLASLVIENPNPTAYSEGDSIKLKNLSADGYRFLGWYDGAGSDATKVTRIDATMAEDIELYAHWEAITYQVQFESDVMLDTSSATYTVGKGLVLPTPKLSNYVFVGWTDADGSLRGKRINPGTTGDITLKANWTSERNRTYSKTDYGDPIIVEDEENNVILAAYEIGGIENVPLYTIKDFGYINGGVTRTETATYSSTVSEGTAQTIAETVSEATTKSSNWVLSENWNESTSVSEEWCQANGYTVEEAESVCKTNGTNWNVSSGQSWSEGSVVEDRDLTGTKHETVTGNKNSGEYSSKATAELNAELKSGIASIGGKLGAEMGEKDGWEHSEGGTDGGTTDKGTITTTDNTHKFNSSNSYGGSSSTSKTNSITKTLSEEISKRTGYGQTYVLGGGSSESQGYSQSQDTSSTYSSTVTFDKTTKQEVASSWTTTSTKPGYHRWVVAGTAHVYGVVGYDIESKSFFVYTLTVMDDETHEFEDYSNISARYNDNENGIISFEVPYEDIMEAVVDRVFTSDGLKFDLQTGSVVGYTGSDTCVIVPEYYNAGNGDVIKVAGLTADAFAGNKDIVTVVLSDYITDIPAGAFEGCESLRFMRAHGVNSIGELAFAGCNSLDDNYVSSSVTSLGVGAFDGSNKLTVDAANKDVVTNAALSGAKSVTVDFAYLGEGEDILSGAVIEAPSSVDRFEINGDGRTFNSLCIDSDAGETVLNRINLVGNTSFPVKISSPKVTLNQSSISSPGIALLLSSPSTEVGLRGTTTISSTGPNAMVCRNVRLYETAKNVVGKLSVSKQLLVYGDITGMSYLDCDSVKTIDEPTYQSLLNPHMVTFDAGEGTCDATARTLEYESAIGELPVPVWDYHTFDGWYLPNGSEPITAETVLPTDNDLTLVAHWTENPVSDWVQLSEVPEDAKVVNTKWTYDLSVYKQVPESYTYYRYCTNYDGIWNQDSRAINENSVYHEITVGSPMASQANRFEDKGGNSAGICGPHGSCQHKREGQSFWWLKRINYKTVLDKVEHKESASKPEGSNISNVIELVQYCAK